MVLLHWWSLKNTSCVCTCVCRATSGASLRACGQRALCSKMRSSSLLIYDTRDYLHSCDFTHVSTDSMNNKCPHQEMTSTFSSLMCYFVKFTSSLPTHVNAKCAFVCDFAPVLFPREGSCADYLPSSIRFNEFSLFLISSL